MGLLKIIPIGVAYAIWCGVGVALIGLRLAWLAVLNFFSKSVAH
jgi:multidrug transporter EmrE-like cation transporter